MLSTWLSYSRSQFDPVCAAEIMHGLQHVPKLLFYTVECSTVSMITTTWLKICVESFAQTICRFHTGLLTLVNLTQSVMIILVVKVKNDHICRLRQYKYWTNNQIVLRLKRSLTNRFQILTLFFEWFCHSTIINCFCDIFQILTSNRLLFRKVHNSSFQTEVLIGERFLRLVCYLVGSYLFPTAYWHIVLLVQLKEVNPNELTLTLISLIVTLKNTSQNIP